MDFYLSYTLKKATDLAKKAIRLITNSPYNSHTKPLFIQLNLLNIEQIKYVQTCELMYRYDNNLLPPAFSSFFAPALLTTQTRSNRSYVCNFARTNTRKFSIRYQGPFYGIIYRISFEQHPVSPTLKVSFVHTQ